MTVEERMAKARAARGKNKKVAETGLTTEEQLKVLAIIKRICKGEDNWISTDFGVSGSKFYIDGLVEYANKEEKDLIKRWLKND